MMGNKSEIRDLAQLLGVEKDSGHYYGCIQGTPLRTVIIAILDHLNVEVGDWFVGRKLIKKGLTAEIKRLKEEDEEYLKKIDRSGK